MTHDHDLVVVYLLPPLQPPMSYQTKYLGINSIKKQHMWHSYTYLDAKWVQKPTFTYLEAK